MKYVLVLLAFLSFYVLAFKPEDIVGAEVKAIGVCKQMSCAVLEKDGTRYIVIGDINDRGEMTPLEIYIVEGKSLRQIWSITWRDT